MSEFGEYVVSFYCEAAGVKQERIVRCRDCKYYSADPWTHYNDEATNANCFFFQDYEGTPATVEPGGFCAWGKRKERE